MDEYKKEQLIEDGKYEADEVGHSNVMSNCCDAPIYEDTDICSKCKEHCESIEEEQA